MRFLWFVALAACLLSLAGCPDQGRRSSVRVEIAPSCSGALPGNLSCFEVQVCESDAPTRCLAVAQSGGPYPPAEEDGVTRLLVQVVGGALSFDVRAAPGTLYDIDVVAYGEPSPSGRSSVVAAGYVTRTSLDGGGTVIRLVPTDAWTCPEVGGVMLRRAFHQAVALSNGDALFIGGITFERTATGLTLVAGTPSASLVPGEESVFVYDAREERFLPVTIDGDAELLARAMFQARWIERTTPDGFERVRLYGGVTGDSTLSFSVSSTNQYPVRVSDAGAEPAPTLDLIYDAATRTVTVDERTGSLETILESERTALPGSSVTSFAALVGGVTSAPEVVTSFGTARETVSDVTLLPSPRRGATISGFGARGYVVYGGNTTQAEPDQTAQRALLFSTTGAMQAVTLPASLTRSALHSASVIDDDTVLFVGGVGIDSATVGPPTGAVVRAFELAASGGALTDVPVSGSGETATERVYHTATLYRAPGADRNSVVVVGGSSRMGTSQFQPLSSAYVVDLSAATAIAPLPALDTARFGHAAVLLRGGRVLVTGGLRRGLRPPGCAPCEETSSLYLVETAEMVVVRPLPAAVSCEAATMDAGPVRTDAGRSPDASSGRDAGTPPDAPSTDDAPAEPDASS